MNPSTPQYEDSVIGGAWRQRSEAVAAAVKTTTTTMTTLWDFTEVFASGRLRSGWLYCIAFNFAGRAISTPLRFQVARKSLSLKARSFLAKCTENVGSFLIRNFNYFRFGMEIPAEPSATLTRHVSDNLKVVKEKVMLIAKKNLNPQFQCRQMFSEP